MPRKITAVDMFCGAGGTSTALLNIAAQVGYEVDLAAINHWTTAIQTHTRNHPEVRHFCERIELLDPLEVVPSGRVDLLVASPECTHHSNARGGKPVNDQSRATALRVAEWCDRLYVRDVLIENVPEFRSWGPIGANGRPLKSKKGQMFEEYLRMFQAMNYRVEYRVLNAADYGDPQTRKRLFIRATRGNKRIVWPEPTHAAVARAGTLIDDRLPWKPARDIIDWSLKGESIFTRKKPLARKTLERICAGLMKYGGPNVGPFLVVLRRHMDGQPLDGPLPTIAAGGTHIGLAMPEPFILPHSMFDRQDVDSIGDPLKTVTATNGRCHRMVEPCIVRYRKGAPAGIDEPLPTQVCKDCFGLAEPFILAHEQFGQDLVDSVDAPMRTLGAHNARNTKLVEPFMVPFFGERDGQEPRTHSVNEPVPCITASKGTSALVEPCIIDCAHGNDDRTGNERRAHSIHDPLRTVAASNGLALTTPLLLYVPDEGYYGLDIRFRMLRPHELAAAQSFPPDYEFAGNAGDVVRQIGNAVPVKLGEALIGAMLA